MVIFTVPYIILLNQFRARAALLLGRTLAQIYAGLGTYHPILTVVFPPICAEKVGIARCCAARQKNANNTRSEILLQKKAGAIDNTEC